MAKEIRLPAPHPRFRPRLEAGIRRVGHPGTTIRIGEDLFEVVSAERAGAEWVYRLEPWTGRDTIRVYVEWNQESERGFLAGLRDDRIQERKAFLVWGAQAFLGFLPVEKQEQLRQTRGLDPARATLWSAVLETAIAVPPAAIFVINIATGGAAGRLVGHVPFWAGKARRLLSLPRDFRQERRIGGRGTEAISRMEAIEYNRGVFRSPRPARV